ncbi:MAG: hypothetical protein M1504_01860 [Candidatus Marsarchaeota archaeon]|nr:hypothetical protein [Candidatus Marsarchaeota archaeon]
MIICSDGFLDSGEAGKQVKDFLDKLLMFPNVELSSDDLELAKKDKAKFIVNRLFSRQFRRAKVHPDTEKDITDKVRKSIDSNEPLYLIICFGGYKHYWNPSYPNIDFAELFDFHFMAEYVAPILKVHAPGVNIDYEFENIAVPLADNYPKKDLDAYDDSFKALVSEYLTRSKAPSNFKINAFIPQEADQYKKIDYETKLFKRMNEILPKRMEEWEHLSKDEKEERLHRTPKAFMWKGEKDLSSLNDEQRMEAMILSKENIEAYYEADFEFRGDYFTGGNHIPIVMTWGLSSENIGHWLTITSAKGCNVDFWVGRGILEVSSGRTVNRIVSQNQYSNIKPKLKTIEAYPWIKPDGPLKNLRSIDLVSTEDFNANVAH